jgi:hypothetical protein
MDVALLLVINNGTIQDRRGHVGALLVNMALDTPCLLPMGLKT